VSDCCTPKGYRQIFSEKNAAGIFDSISDQGIEGRALLEVGGGVGAIEIELIKAGMARAVNVELTPTTSGGGH
jgi:magnesium-protoporphyrin O-methyltransferase